MLNRDQSAVNRALKTVVDKINDELELVVDAEVVVVFKILSMSIF